MFATKSLFEGILVCFCFVLFCYRNHSLSNFENLLQYSKMLVMLVHHRPNPKTIF